MPQSLSNVLCHLVFSTKNRDPHLNETLRPGLFAYMAGILQGLGCEPILLGGVEDHLHVLLALSRTESIAEMVKKLKTGSTSWSKGSGLARTDFAWQNGYGIFSVSADDKSVVIQYIENQEAHHRKLTFQDEFRELMRLAGVQWDEKYVWD